MMRLDSHQHFIDYTPEDYPWMGDQHHTLKRSYYPEQLKPLLDSIQFDGAVVVQARQLLKETDWLLQLADEHAWIMAVVGWVDLCSTELAKQLQTYSRNPKFKGVRHVIHDEPDDRFMLQADFIRGIAQLEQYNLTFDLLVFEKHLPYTIQLVKQFPNQKFVLDHMAKPNIAGGEIESWKELIYELAQYDNVYCKCSGLVTEANLANWTYEDFVPYLDVIFDAFGTDRVMIGSDWPVCTLSRDYASVMNIVMEYIARHRPTVQEQVLGGNCARFYNIK